MEDHAGRVSPRSIHGVLLTSSSCVVAGRLANLDHNLQVMLVEAGESNLNNPWVFRPGIYPRNMKLDSKTATFYYSRPSEWLSGRRAIVPCAHILGGGSSINFMVSVIKLYMLQAFDISSDVHPCVRIRLR